VEDYETVVSPELSGENRFWYLEMVRKTMEVVYDCIEYCVVDIHVMQKTNFIPKQNIKICELDDEKDTIVFMSLDQAKEKMKRVNYYLDDTIMIKNTRYKHYFFTLWDETKTNVLCEKIHISNMTIMMDDEEEQELTDGREYYLFPEKLVKEYENKKMLYANKYSDMKFLSRDKYY